MEGLKQRYDDRVAQDIARLRARIDVTFKGNPFRSLTQRFVVAASPRTGSTLLCERLLSHGAVVTESLLPVHVVKACEKRGNIGLEIYCERYLKRNTPGGVFGTKGWAPLLAPLVLSGEFPTYLHEWKFVHLTRSDILKQAISGAIAAGSRAWKSGKAPAKILTDDDFDADAIVEKMNIYAVNNQKWDDFFLLFGIEPLRITYEQLAAEPDGVTASVADYLNLRGAPVKNKRFDVPLQVQSTNINSKWEERFRKLNLPVPTALAP